MIELFFLVFHFSQSVVINSENYFFHEKSRRVLSKSSNSTFQPKFYEKYSREIELGATVCPRSAGFGDQKFTYDGVIFPQAGTVDYEKVRFIHLFYAFGTTKKNLGRLTILTEA